MKVPLWKRFLIKLDAVIVESVPEEIFRKTGESIMALHYCKHCKDYKYGTLFDPMSQRERVYCMQCLVRTNMKDVCGLLFFRVRVCLDTSKLVANKLKVKSSIIKGACKHFLFFRFLTSGLGKYAPCDRGNKTISELEEAERDRFIETLTLLNSMGKF
jgi:hypothetical protein